MLAWPPALRWILFGPSLCSSPARRSSGVPSPQKWRAASSSPSRYSYSSIILSLFDLHLDFFVTSSLTVSRTPFTLISSIPRTPSRTSFVHFFLDPFLLMFLSLPIGSSVDKRSCLHFTSCCFSSSLRLRANLPCSYVCSLFSFSIAFVFDLRLSVLVGCRLSTLVHLLSLLRELTSESSTSTHFLIL